MSLFEHVARYANLDFVLVDRTGFQQDINVAFPIDRLHELAAEDRIGSVADFHYSVMGATAPQHMEAAAHELSGHFKADGVDAVLLVPI